MEHTKINKSQAILKGAEELFLEKGYAKVTYQQISNTVGISKSLLQYYYPKKIKILEQILYSNFTHWLNTIPEEDDYVKFTTFFLKFFQFISEKNQVRNFMLEIIDNNELLDIFTSFFEQWLIKSKITENNRKLIKSSLVFALSGSLQLYRFNETLKFPIESITDTLITTFFRFLGYSDKSITSTFQKAQKYYKNIKHDDWVFVDNFDIKNY
ncbi:Bacterial regulatory proteins, tetR family [Leuconostoc suionicum]|uniref:Bacterial regulatory proteins, tetR family n=1 Tax=Leuconostoc suionicum TaxID=1511761 RepID=A0A2N9KGE0_9LACO|nr:TetR/AcrR family transcriptional regulator [Leuconostoc suionicum]SPD95078.1 Bacterial regulatory proteins, tetR family [Leuconostoc suionicum]SPE09882.1 Bacterial regulatory proteins, tetR family [Leuconostoc suionicum]SPH05681.1 Bacterial regulatory proteins, tetR family [Leuconostoc suionicum]